MRGTYGPGLDDDVATVRAVLRDSSSPTILVVQSYGELVAAEAAPGWGRRRTCCWCRAISLRSWWPGRVDARRGRSPGQATRGDWVAIAHSLTASGVTSVTVRNTSVTARRFSGPRVHKSGDLDRRLAILGPTWR